MSDRVKVVVAKLETGEWAAHVVNKNGSLQKVKRHHIGEKNNVVDAVFVDYPEAAIEIYNALPDEVDTSVEDQLIAALEEDLARAKQGKEDKLALHNLLNEVKKVKV